MMKKTIKKPEQNANPWKLVKVVSYRIVQYGTGNWLAIIHLMGTTGEYDAKLRFKKEGSDIGNAFEQFGVYIVNFSYTQFQGIVDMLRYEKPVYLHYNSDKKLGYLSTVDEPVGEEET